MKIISNITWDSAIQGSLFLQSVLFLLLKNVLDSNIYVIMWVLLKKQQYGAIVRKILLNHRKWNLYVPGQYESYFVWGNILLNMWDDCLDAYMDYLEHFTYGVALFFISDDYSAARRTKWLSRQSPKRSHRIALALSQEVYHGSPVTALRKPGQNGRATCACSSQQCWCEVSDCSWQLVTGQGERRNLDLTPFPTNICFQSRIIQLIPSNHPEWHVSVKIDLHHQSGIIYNRLLEYFYELWLFSS